jgi:O-antigen/teichoic acid export membrane protein
MSAIRRQSIISSAVVYFGFALGFLNTYLFTRQGSFFTKEEYGLTGGFIAIANVMYSVASLGMPAYINKFFPYYRGHLTTRKNDMLTLALGISSLGFVFVLFFGWAFQDFVLERFQNSPGLDQYYGWIFVFGFGFTIYNVLEAYTWQSGKPVLTTFLKEVLLRLCTTVLILLAGYGLLKTFDTFIKLYAFLFLFIAFILLGYLLTKGKAALVFRISRVTERFFNKILMLCSFVWAGSLVFNVAMVFDSIVLMAVVPNGLAIVGIYTLAQNISSLIQAPQRGIISAAMGPLSQAWKEKDYGKINRIYQRSSINQLLFSGALFSLIWLNFQDGVETFRLQPGYLQAQQVFLYIGLMRIIDMGTGVNAQIIGTSTYWRFEFVTGLILLGLSLPLNFVLTRHLGVIGPAISNLIAFTIYNGIRYFFLLKKFGMQPFTRNTGVTLLVTALAFGATYLLFRGESGLLWMALRSTFFVFTFTVAVIYLKLSPDIAPVLETLKKRLGFGRNRL